MGSKGNARVWEFGRGQEVLLTKINAFVSSFAGPSLETKEIVRPDELFQHRAKLR
jgi:hypothetical protein